MSGIPLVIKSPNMWQLQVWDTAGQERFRTITQSYYRSAHAVVIVYDVTNRTSYEHVPSWLEEVEYHSGRDVSKALVGNKADCRTNRIVSAEEGQSMASKHSMTFLETSAKTASNVEELFLEVGKCLCAKIEQGNVTNSFLAGKRKDGFVAVLDTQRIGIKGTVATGCCRV